MTPEQRAAHAAYMREWNQRDRERKLVARRARYDQRKDEINERRREGRPSRKYGPARSLRPRRVPPTPEQRFWAKVDRSGGPDACWLWTGAGVGRAGELYGGIRWDGGRTRHAHRVAYELLVGPVPDGLVLDHLCRVRLCVNPAHLEPVTNRENILRGNGITAQEARRTHCPKGHSEWRPRARGGRTCVPCARTRDLAAYYRKRETGRWAA